MIWSSRSRRCSICADPRVLCRRRRPAFLRARLSPVFARTGFFRQKRDNREEVYGATVFLSRHFLRALREGPRIQKQKASETSRSINRRGMFDIAHCVSRAKPCFMTMNDIALFAARWRLARNTPAFANRNRSGSRASLRAGIGKPRRAPNPRVLRAHACPDRSCLKSVK